MKINYGSSMTSLTSSLMIKVIVLFTTFSIFSMSIYLLNNQNSNIKDYKILSNSISSKNEFYKGKIYMDWPFHSDHFNYINYKSLESILANFHGSNVKVLHLGPNIADYYKLGSMISKHQFQKYLKRGYRIEVEIQGIGKRNQVSIGQFYWESQIIKCCSIAKSKNIMDNFIIPFHLHVFNRLYNLKLEGGIYTDFSFMHRPTSPILMSKIDNGVVMITNCSIEEKKSSINICSTSMLLIFKNNSIIVDCMLENYNVKKNNNKSEFMDCILSDQISGGSHCIRDAFITCFSKYNIKNSFTNLFEKSLLIEGKYFNTHVNKDDKSFFYPDIDNNIDLKMSMSVAIGNSDKITEKLWTKQINNKIIATQQQSIFSRMYSYFINKENFNQEILLNQNYASIFWLGIESFSGQWSIPISNSIFDIIIKENVLYKHNELNYINRLPSQNRDKCLNKMKLPSCSNYYSKPFIYTNSNIRQANVSCASSFVIAGFMKAGTSYLYSALSSHPQVLNNLRGVAFKETGCYMPESMQEKKEHNRMNCFPFVEKGDTFIYGDATVFYSSRKQVPEYLLRDNLNIKVLFIVRDPIERTKSHHRFSFKSLSAVNMSDINEIISISLNPLETDGLPGLYNLAIEAASTIKGSRERAYKSDLLLEKYLLGLKGSKSDKLYKKCANIIFHSLYFPSIYMWKKKFCHKRILVISAEQLNPSASSLNNKINYNSTTNLININKVYDYLGLCPRFSIPDFDQHETRSDVLENYSLNKTMKLKLKEFYKPFNQLLFDLIDENFNYNDNY